MRILLFEHLTEYDNRWFFIGAPMQTDKKMKQVQNRKGECIGHIPVHNPLQGDDLFIQDDVFQGKIAVN